MSAGPFAAVAEATGWTIHHRTRVDSTNDLAAALRDDGAGGRMCVVADLQWHGRGRAGRSFASPLGGLYVSLLVDAPTAHVPAGLVALSAVAAAEAIEAVAETRALIKWPNDLWVEGKKVGGVLLEAAEPGRAIVVGIGINLEGVPSDLPADVARGVGALEPLTRQVIEREEVLAALLRRVDAWCDRWTSAEGSEVLEKAWQARQALVGREIRYLLAGETGARHPGGRQPRTRSPHPRW